MILGMMLALMMLVLIFSFGEKNGICLTCSCLGVVLGVHGAWERS